MRRTNELEPALADGAEVDGFALDLAGGGADSKDREFVRFG
jgi:hypothetical protein